MVNGCAATRDDNTLPSVHQWGCRLARQDPFTLTNVANPVCRLCPLATAVVTRRGAFVAARLLARATGRSASPVDTSYRSTTSSSAELSRCNACATFSVWIVTATQELEPAGRGNAVHDRVSSFSGTADALQRSVRCRGGHCYCQSHAGRTGGLDWLFCQYTGAAYRFVGEPQFQNIAGPCTWSRFAGLYASRRSVWKTGGRIAARTGPEPSSFVSGAFSLAKCTWNKTRTARNLLDSTLGWEPDRQVWSEFDAQRGTRGAPNSGGV